MWLDIVFIIILIAAVIKGISRGIIMAIFSFIGWFIGLAAALKLSASLAAYLQDHTAINSKWLPLLSFIIVFVIAVLLVQLAGKAVEKIFTISLLGWVNKLGGALLYAAMYTLAFSIILFFAEKMHLISEATASSSRVYGMLSGLGPSVIEAIGTIMPFIKNSFHELEKYFENAGKKRSLI
ncbi:colicin V production protein [Terrimonas sp.]|uniref:CvpA family protein n=1 Tax=Terrimonas sp. TaxID=1914338 RepID=UPI000D5065D7|nr:CvpA family protein [Terrimonas sp.]PVD49840.1 colicin V production protein [Terrimonas sp.]